MKKIIPALALLLISACLLSTASYAWFSMNTQVTASGMNVKAKAEGGIVISSDSSTWTANATASHSSETAVVPTSTTDLSSWYHAVSDDAKSAKQSQTTSGAYTQLSVVENGGIGSAGTGADKQEIYIYNTFYIKSSAEAVTVSSGLLINSVDVEFPTTQKTEALNKSLRVGVYVTYGSAKETKIFAPVSGHTTTYKVNNNNSLTPIAAGTKDTALTSITDIPAYSTTTPIVVKIYVFYEGEDANCKSENLDATIDKLTVSVTFGTTTKTTAATVKQVGNNMVATVANAPTGTPTYKWEYADTATATSWTSVADTTATITPSDTLSGKYYKCTVTYGSGTDAKEYSSVAQYNTIATPTITNNSGTMTVKVNSQGQTIDSYLWYSSTDGSTWTAIDTATTATCARDGILYYKCAVTIGGQTFETASLAKD